VALSIALSGLRLGEAFGLGCEAEKFDGD